MRLSPLLLAVALAAPAAASLHAQNITTGPCTHDHGEHWGSRAHVCEQRSATLPFRNNRVDVLNANGGIEIVGEDRRDIALEADVHVQGRSEAEVQSTLHEITLDLNQALNDPIQARGPRPTGDNLNWYVNYRLRVPHRLAGDLRSSNGGLSLRNLDGDIHAQTTNGGLELFDLAGNINAITTNGGVTVTLTGSQWQGAGLNAQSTNGGIDLHLPQPFNAHLIASTVNGGLDLGFPITVQGVIKNHIDTNLGSGGPTIHLQTTNGGISIGKH